MRRTGKRRWDDGRRSNRLTPIEQSGWRNPPCADCDAELLIEPDGIVHYITGKDGTTIHAFFCAECGRKREDDDFKDRKRRRK